MKMVRVFIQLLLVLLFAASSHSADTKISAMTEATTLSDTDILPVVIDPSSSAVNRKITFGNFRVAGTFDGNDTEINRLIAAAIAGGTLPATFTSVEVVRGNWPGFITIYEPTGAGTDYWKWKTSDNQTGPVVNITPLDVCSANQVLKVASIDGDNQTWECADLAGGGDFLADGTVPMTGDLTIGSATPDIVLNDSDDAAGTASIKANSSGGANDIILTIGVEDSTGAGTSYIEVDGVSETVDLLKPVAIDAAGVKLTGSNGSLTILGIGDGQNEDVKIDLNTTANTIEITSPASSADAIDINTLNFVSTGWIQGGIKVDSDANGEDNTTMAAAGLYGTLFIATGTGTWTLPTAVLGMSMCLMSSGAAAELILDVQPTDTMRLKGAEDTAGDGITNAAGEAAGDFICVVAVANNKWSTMGMQGSWAQQ